MTLGLHHLDNLVDIFLAVFMVGGFHHHADYRLRAGLANKYAAIAAEGCRHLGHLCFYIFVVLCGCLVFYFDIFQNLREYLQLGDQLI